MNRCTEQNLNVVTHFTVLMYHKPTGKCQHDLPVVASVLFLDISYTSIQALFLPLTYTHTQTHTQPVPVRCLRAWHLPQKLPSHCLHGAVINVALDQSAHTASSLDTNQTLMKTSEMPPRPLASTHTVPNHMPLLTPKHTPLIGAIVEKLLATTRGPKM